MLAETTILVPAESVAMANVAVVILLPGVFEVYAVFHERLDERASQVPVVPLVAAVPAAEAAVPALRPLLPR